MDQSQAQPGMAQEGTDQQPPLAYPLPCCLNQEPTVVMGMRVSQGAKAARITNCAGFVLFALLVAYESFNLRMYLTNNPGVAGSITNPAVLDGGIPFIIIFIGLIVANCLGFCVKNKAWTAYIWIEANTVGTLCMLLWIIILFTDEGIRSIRNGSYTPLYTPGPTLRFLELGLFIVLGGLGMLFTMVMLAYAKFLEEGQKPHVHSDGTDNMGEPMGSQDGNQVQPALSQYSQPPAQV